MAVIDEQVDVGDRRTQQRVFSREDIIHRRKSGFVKRNFYLITDHRGNAFVAKSPARFAGDDGSALKQNIVKPADSFDDSSLHIDLGFFRRKCEVLTLHDGAVTEQNNFLRAFHFGRRGEGNRYFFAFF